jgi:hypothetical protein
MSDDQGWKQTGYAGSSTVISPNLDTMAASGMQLNRFYATAPVCAPTCASVLTGRHHNRHGCFNVKNCVLDTQETTLAEAVKKANYVTGHFGKWHIGRLKGPESSSPGDNGFDQWVSSMLFFDLDSADFVRNGENVPQINGDGSDFIVEEAIEFIEDAVNNNEKFLAVIWYAAPHSPWDALDSDKAIFDNLSEEEQNFYGEIYAMDRSIGTLRTKLKELNIEQDTLLWFMGDNGPQDTNPDPKASGALKGSKGVVIDVNETTPNYPVAPESDALFNFGEQNFSTYFSSPNAVTQSIDGYFARYYSKTDTWLGTKDGVIYVYGNLFNDIPPVGLSIKNVGMVTDYIPATNYDYVVVDAGQTVLYNNNATLTSIQQGEPFFGQDANYLGTPFSYINNDDGTISDNNTGLLWEQAHHAERLSYYSAKTACENLELGGHNNWRLPSLKELFSLADFRGSQWKDGHFYLDSNMFSFDYPDAVSDDDQFSTHTVQMMGQTWSSTIYTGDHWNKPNVEAAFFFNFLDGHIKQAPTSNNDNFYRCVYGDEYGVNDFIVNGDGTVTDKNSGLVWQQQDDGVGRNWQDSLAYCEELELAGQTDWRLPDIKELQSIVDYTRHDPAIDPTAFTLSDSEGWFWSGTTHGDNVTTAAYICFGKCDSKDGVDTHGAGAQRTDPKIGEPADYSNFGGAQDDDVRIKNYSRCVRGGVADINFVTTDLDSAGNIPNGNTAGPPQEAIDACNGLTENANCSIQAGNKTISGSCSNLQGTLACKPK